MDRLSAFRRRQDYVPAEAVDGGVGGKVASGSMWSGISVGATTLLQFVRSMVFARLLDPADFGVVGLANVFTYFVLIFTNFGFNSSVIYHRRLDRRDLATCWWGNLGVDFLAALVCVALAFGTRRFVDDPQVPWVIALLALQFMITSLGSVNAALMRRAFMFRQITAVSVVGGVVTFAASLAGVALMGWGVYGLVAGMVAGSAAMTLMQLALMPWLPSRSFSWSSLRMHVGYGRWFLGINIVNYVNHNIDRFFIGTMLDSTRLGYYEYAISIPIRTATELGRVVNGVLFPAFASLQNDLAELRRVVLKAMRYSTLLVYPLLVGLALLAGDFVLVAYGEKWRPIVAPLQVFCLVGLPRIAFGGLFPLCFGLGRPHLPFKWALIALPLNAAALYLGLKGWGIFGVAVAKAFLDLFMLSTLRTEIMRHVGLRLEQQLRAFSPAVVACLIMTAVLAGARLAGLSGIASPLVRLLAHAAVGAAAYVTAVALLFPVESRFLRTALGRLRNE